MATKWLMDSPGFNDPAAWIDDYLPCSRERAIFPEKYEALLPLPAKVDVGGFVLPKDGAIFLQMESTITLEGNDNKRDCDKGKAVLKQPTVRKWFDPKTWRSSKDVVANAAIPDMERVPCNNESVVIRANGPLALDLENIAYLRMGQMSFAGSLLSRDYLRQLLYNDLGQFLFRNQAGVNVEYYHHDVCGCHKDFNNFGEPICHNIIESCERPHCLVPVMPYGSCCAICGAVIKFQVEFCEDRRYNWLQTILREAIKDQDLQGDLDYYVNYVNSQNYGNYLQAVIVDRDGYSERSVKFLAKLNETIDWVSRLKLDRKHIFGIEYSGRPYNPNVTFGSILLIFLCLIFVSVVALVIFAHYNPDNQYLHYVPRWVYDPNRWRSLFQRRDAVFARFDNTRASVITTADVGGSGGGRSVAKGFTRSYGDDDDGDAESGDVRSKRAFDNPLFDEKPSTSTSKGKSDGLAMEVATSSSGSSIKEVPQLLMESVDMSDTNIETHDDDHEDEQELTEIKLDTSSDEEDTKEQETKE
ncbi:protein amnionless [Musca vetustissima]|uniref:protein amnionless n=1 Tax=Musca vetustissima TaxID=27455 RepID=UPI002AB668BE|nr:protein amnionless [Musca vetustissima]